MAYATRLYPRAKREVAAQFEINKNTILEWKKR
jgi:hypothetical protein